jgi:DNA-binding MarR family transcriptional regulator
MRRVLDAQLNRELERDSGLSEPDYDVLSNLSEQPGRRMRARELGARLQWSSSRLTHHIKRMERRGLVRREECADDARGADVELTDAGLASIESAAPAHVASVRRHFIDHLAPPVVDR